MGLDNVLKYVSLAVFSPSTAMVANDKGSPVCASTIFPWYSLKLKVSDDCKTALPETVAGGFAIPASVIAEKARADKYFIDFFMADDF